ncbi:hypothetical protein IT571_00820 [Candidatus Sumerlaeota bacterium]|nr:hypothetical protein [Candidatus Sumerlaeota bacterium]HMZ51754.1 hypothetical protein [Candidatus Sumerlaeota bacterium]
MTRRISSLLRIVAIVAIGITAGACSRASRGPDTADGNAKAFERTRARINLLDTKLDSKIASDFSGEERLPDGRMQVVLNMRNKTSKNLHVQVRAVFKDGFGLSTGDETPWEEMYFSPRQAKTYRVQSKLTTPASYTVEVRLPVKAKGKGTS